VRVLWIPIFSMRSHETGKYSILKDGNFQLTMARVLASNFDQVVVAVPVGAADFDEVLERFKDHTRVSFVCLEYGLNAVETRERFWELNADMIWALDRLSDFVITDITGYNGEKPFANNFNITKLPELDRPYIDRFFESDLNSIERGAFTTVLNPRQREYILEVRPDLVDKVFVNTKCVHASMLPKIDPPHKTEAERQKIFWPFRISDKAYKFDQFIDVFDELNLSGRGWTIETTDPNDSMKHERAYIGKMKPTKSEYYELLAKRPVVVMLDDIDTVLHPGTIEFFHYGCPVVTYNADLIRNPNTIVHLSEIGARLNSLSYNEVEIGRFRFAEGETDAFYNKVFCRVKSN